MVNNLIQVHLTDFIYRHFLVRYRMANVPYFKEVAYICTALLINCKLPLEKECQRLYFTIFKKNQFTYQIQS